MKALALFQKKWQQSIMTILDHSTVMTAGVKPLSVDGGKLGSTGIWRVMDSGSRNTPACWSSGLNLTKRNDQGSAGRSGLGSEAPTVQDSMEKWQLGRNTCE